MGLTPKARNLALYHSGLVNNSVIIVIKHSTSHSCVGLGTAPQQTVGGCMGIGMGCTCTLHLRRLLRNSVPSQDSQAPLNLASLWPVAIALLLLHAFPCLPHAPIPPCLLPWVGQLNISSCFLHPASMRPCFRPSPSFLTFVAATSQSKSLLFESISPVHACHYCDRLLDFLFHALNLLAISIAPACLALPFESFDSTSSPRPFWPL